MLAMIRNQLQEIDLDLKLVMVGGAYSWIDIRTGLLQGGLYDTAEEAMSSLKNIYTTNGTQVLFKKAA